MTTNIKISIALAISLLLTLNAIFGSQAGIVGWGIVLHYLYTFALIYTTSSLLTLLLLNQFTKFSFGKTFLLSMLLGLLVTAALVLATGAVRNNYKQKTGAENTERAETAINKNLKTYCTTRNESLLTTTLKNTSPISNALISGAGADKVLYISYPGQNTWVQKNINLEDYCRSN